MKIQALQVGPIGTNCYIFCDEGAKVCGIVDPGGEPEVILDAVKKLGCTVDKILLTHGHDDHVGGVAGIRAACPDIPVYLNERDAAMQKPGMERLFPPVPDTVSYDEGDILAVGNIPVRVHATPGHTPGGVTLECGQLLFCGDTLFAGSCGRTDFPGGDADAEMASLRKLAALPGDYTLQHEREANQYMAYAVRSGK